jgi:hypothetical protein
VIEMLLRRRGERYAGRFRASLLVAAGLEPEEAFRRIEKARGRPVPDTPEQREWVAQNVSEAAASIRSHQD